MDESIYGPHMPPIGSVHGAHVDQLIHVLHWFMAALFIGWGIFYLYCLIRFRARDGHEAQYQPVKATVSKYLEIGVAIFEVFLLVGLSMPVWAELKDEFPEEKDSLVVRVVAEQFAWNFHYAGADGKFGKSSREKMTRSNPLGIDYADPAAADDITTINNFYLPTGKPVIVHLTSKDVIHSFGIPVLRVKQDAVPGMDVPIWFEATREGVYEVACAQLCGVGHYRMGAKVHVQTPEEYDAWFAQEQAALQEE